MSYTHKRNLKEQPTNLEYLIRELMVTRILVREICSKRLLSDRNQKTNVKRPVLRPNLESKL